MDVCLKSDASARGQLSQVLFHRIDKYLLHL
jgi:hypothetical protein